MEAVFVSLELREFGRQLPFIVVVEPTGRKELSAGASFYPMLMSFVEKDAAGFVLKLLDPMARASERKPSRRPVQLRRTLRTTHELALDDLQVL